MSALASWITWATSALRLLLVTAALLVATGTVLSGGGHPQRTVWASDGHATTVVWTPAMAHRYPDCGPSLRLQPPASVIEVGNSGIPVRVGFAEAWRRTHDATADNSGRIVAQCRSRH